MWHRMRTFIRTAPKDRRIYKFRVYAELRRDFGIAGFSQYRVSKFAQPEDFTGRFYICPKAKDPTGIRRAEVKPKMKPARPRCAEEMRYGTLCVPDVR